MNDFRQVYGVFCDIWALYKQYGRAPLDDDGWDAFVDAGQKQYEKNRAESEKLGRLYLDAYTAVQKYVSGKEP
ncbi:MAG: hypothetical protein Q4C73_03100 [Eubacteriales bacterium]|nr:hypothetical protein [Eubacteriales bacterium]